MSICVVNVNENIIDIALRCYGNILGIVDIARNNNISFSSEITPGQKLITNDAVDYSRIKSAMQKTNSANAIQNVIMPNPGQNIFDIAIQECGSIKGVVDIAKNNNVALTGNLDLSKEYIISDTYNKLIVQYFTTKNKPSTGSELIINNAPVKEGIGYWTIQNNFIIQ